MAADQKRPKKKKKKRKKKNLSGARPESRKTEAQMAGTNTQKHNAMAFRFVGIIHCSKLVNIKLKMRTRHPI